MTQKVKRDRKVSRLHSETNSAFLSQNKTHSRHDHHDSVNQTVAV